MIKLSNYKQSNTSLCGPAVIKIILKFYGIKAAEREIAKRCGHTYELGCTDLQMKEAIESYGLKCNIYNKSTLEDLEYWIGNGMPVIVDWFSGGISVDEAANGHSSIVVGIDDKKVMLNDPQKDAYKIVRMPRQDFMRVWFDWRYDPYITTWKNMVLRQAMIVYTDEQKEIVQNKPKKKFKKKKIAH